MEFQFLNNGLKAAVPDGFHVMDAAELAKFNIYKEFPDWSISDPERHIIISVSWRKSGLGALMLNSKDVAKKMETALQKPMAAFGYKLQGFESKNVGGTAAEGFRYTYTAQNINMIGESYSVKKGKTFYYIHCYYRAELETESIRVLQVMAESCEWV
ncbi:MAG: hypothetical protein K5637_00645 [Lachnospiraceae bacterium]|nr:hypothetical protein [Lachnospiraceae bacterium]